MTVLSVSLSRRRSFWTFLRLKENESDQKKAKPKRGSRPPSQPRVDTLLLASGPGGNPSLPIAQQEDCPPPKVKKPRINWAVGDKNAEVMHCAVKDWDNGKGIDEN
jgi:hypothetical protein